MHNAKKMLIQFLFSISNILSESEIFHRFFFIGNLMQRIVEFIKYLIMLSMIDD
jgi:hypothetical protein